MMNLAEQLDFMTDKRREITNYDLQILSLLEKRVAAAQEIGAIKRMNNKPLYTPEVEREKIADLAQKSKYPGLVETLWPVIMCYTRSIE